MNLSYKKIEENDDSYPQVIKQLNKYPKNLYVSGEILSQDLEGIAVVGSRIMSSYGEAVIESIVGELVLAGITIISGLAFGVDVKSHETALKLKGRTLAVLGSGINNIVPVSNESVACEIVEKGKGALISAYEPNASSEKWRFIERNHLIAAISKAILVIEASVNSGTRHTVDAALNMGKEVFVVPGSIFSLTSEGCNNYIKEGAKLVTSAQDVFDSFGKIYSKFIDSNALSFQTDLERRIYDVLTIEGVKLEDICKSLLEPVSRVLQAVTLMEFRGIVKVEGLLIRKAFSSF